MNEETHDETTKLEEEVRCAYMVLAKADIGALEARQVLTDAEMKRFRLLGKSDNAEEIAELETKKAAYYLATYDVQVCRGEVVVASERLKRLAVQMASQFSNDVLVKMQDEIKSAGAVCRFIDQTGDHQHDCVGYQEVEALEVLIRKIAWILDNPGEDRELEDSVSEKIITVLNGESIRGL